MTWCIPGSSTASPGNGANLARNVDSCDRLVWIRSRGTTEIAGHGHMWDIRNRRSRGTRQRVPLLRV